MYYLHLLLYNVTKSQAGSKNSPDENYPLIPNFPTPSNAIAERQTVQANPKVGRSITLWDIMVSFRVVKWFRRR
jgi:hypothetical protein